MDMFAEQTLLLTRLHQRQQNLNRIRAPVSVLQLKFQALLLEHQQRQPTLSLTLAPASVLQLKFPPTCFIQGHDHAPYTPKAGAPHSNGDKLQLSDPCHRLPLPPTPHPHAPRDTHAEYSNNCGSSPPVSSKATIMPRTPPRLVTLTATGTSSS
jgi:hypothetical protein